MARCMRTLVAGLLFLTFPPGAAAATCTQDSAPRPAPGAAITLEPLAGQGLTFSKGSVNTRTVSAVGGQIPRPGRSATASVVQPQDTNFHSSDFEVVAAAHVLEPGDRVQIRICTSGGKAADAGTFSGQVSVFGPAFKPQNYDYTVTARYAWFIPATILAFLGGIYMLLMLANNGLPAVARTNKTNQVTFAMATMVGFCLAYFTVYDADDTWGDQLVSDLVSLVTGGVTVATVVTGFMAKLIRNEKPDQREEPASGTKPKLAQTELKLGAKPESPAA